MALWSLILLLTCVSLSLCSKVNQDGETLVLVGSGGGCSGPRGGREQVLANPTPQAK